MYASKDGLTEKKKHRLIVNISRFIVRFLTTILYCFISLCLVTFIGALFNLQGDQLIDYDVIKNTIDTINEPLSTPNLKVNSIIADSLNSKYNFHINNYKYNLKVKRILYLNSVFENIIQEMYRFNNSHYNASASLKFDSIANMCRFTEKYLYDNFLIEVNSNKLTIQEYFELINKIKNIKFNNPKLYYVLCDNLKDNILLDSNTVLQYIKNKSYNLDQRWVGEPHKLNLSNSWDTLLNKNKSRLNEDLTSPSTIIEFYLTQNNDSTSPSTIIDLYFTNK